jgi:hypothetical protein
VLPVCDEWIKHRLADALWIAAARKRLQSISWFMLLVDYTGRLFREGKAIMPAELCGIFGRLGCTAEKWTARLEKLREGRWLGRFFASSRAKLREIARSLKLRHLVNLGGCPA